MPSYAEGLTPRIRQILSGSDLSTVSAKGVRKTLVAEGEDERQVKAHKADIDQIIGEIYEQLAQEAEGSESEDEQPLAGSHKPKQAKTEAKKEAKPDVEDVGQDAAMAARMQADYDAMMANRRPARASASSSSKKAKPAKTKAKRKSAAKAEDSDDEEGPKKKKGRGGAFNKELILSDALSAFLNETRLSRPQTVKRIWDYIKDNDLQDPADRRYILCDDEMKKVFPTDKLHMFTMNKMLAHHFRDPDDVV